MSKTLFAPPAAFNVGILPAQTGIFAARRRSCFPAYSLPFAATRRKPPPIRPSRPACDRRHQTDPDDGRRPPALPRPGKPAVFRHAAVRARPESTKPSIRADNDSRKPCRGRLRKLRRRLFCRNGKALLSDEFYKIPALRKTPRAAPFHLNPAAVQASGHRFLRESSGE